MNNLMFRVQKELTISGYECGRIDGFYGPRTEAAFSRWYYANKCGCILRPFFIPPPKPEWLRRAEAFLGVEEISGAGSNPIIAGFFKRTVQKALSDDIAWCAAFVCAALEACGIESPKSLLARSFTKWGVTLDNPQVGCIAVFYRGSRSGWKGHVGIVVGQTLDGKLAILGGNQGDMVTIRAYSTKRLLCYKWPESDIVPLGSALRDLPLVPITSILKSES